ncbi:amino-acid transporter subunit; membrane component of ABC superfamily [Mesorhizobium plurifarium]|uniref:Amino-acid transporter subunit membrane component of ABC superfamily n=1 Tax=Mesorhizobium plurifarium TaxID=69974 RepID=A0A0K2VQH2_MESPL|nr:amino-acid transporter subunit; membrane component of ABC superfamily [Mesorhizobium plurifarium]
MSLTIDPVPGPEGPGILRRISLWWGDWPLTQVAVILAVVALFWLFGHNTAATMARVGITPGFGFLARPANFEIGEAPIAFAAGDTYARAILAGFLNTLRVAVLGCVFATVLGVLFGVASLSGNLLLAVLVRWYVEIIRNTPLLLQLFFWIGLVKSLPPPRQAISAFHSFFLTNRGVFLPGLVFHNAAGLTWLATIGLVLILGGMSWLLWRRGQLTVRRAGLGLLALAVGVVAIFALTGSYAELEVPVLAGFNIRGGYNLTPEFAALLTGLVVKFSAAIAEIVRAGILSVSRGQWEAARALGLHNGQIMRLVVLPQALRVITPLTTSSYLDLVKDSSLAVAIGYPDLVSIVGTTANTTGQSFEALAILIAIYLAINLSVSAGMNVYNQRVALRGAVRA